MAFVHKDQGIILRGEAADLLQGCNVAVHGKGRISGHQADSMLLQGRQGQWQLVSQAEPNHPPSVLLGALRAYLAPCPEQRWSRKHYCFGTRTSSLIYACLSLTRLFRGSPEPHLALGSEDAFSLPFRGWGGAIAFHKLISLLCQLGVCHT